MAFEYAILDWIQENLRGPLPDAVMVAITRLGDGGILFMVLGLWLAFRPATRNLGITLLLALLLEILVCNGLLKPLVARARPFAARSDIRLLIAAPADFSFPSGHTTAAFTAGAVLTFGRSRWRAPVMLLAVLIGFSRLYLYVHFPTDVLSGGVLGFFIGWFTWRVIQPSDFPTTQQKRAGRSV